MRYRPSREDGHGLKGVRCNLAQRALFVAFLLTHGCTGWRGVPLEAVPSPSPTLRVHLRDGTSVILRDAFVRADSIVGVRSGSMPPAPVVVALAQVERAEVAETDRSKTAAVIVGATILGLSAFGLLVLWAVTHPPT